MPDVLDSEEVRRAFEELLAKPKPSSSDEAIDFAIALWEIADRQWHTYSQLDARTKKSLDDWIAANWNSKCEKMTGYLLGVIGNVGLSNSFQLMKDSLDGQLPSAVRKKISEAINEFGATVEDPHSSMKK
jgi:hypothetical protein